MRVGRQPFVQMLFPFISIYLVFEMFTFSKLMEFFFFLQDLKDYFRKAGEVTYTSAHKIRECEGYDAG